MQAQAEMSVASQGMVEADQSHLTCLFAKHSEISGCREHMQAKVARKDPSEIRHLDLHFYLLFTTLADFAEGV